MDTVADVVLIGSKELGFRALQDLYSLAPSAFSGMITIDDRADPRSSFALISAFARDRNIRLWVASNRAHSESLIREIKPQRCFVVGWYWLIGEETLKSVPLGFFGIHNSLLPKYRGGAPLVWAMLNGEKTVGISLYTLTPGIDDGVVWGQKSVTVEEEDYISDVFEKLAVKTSELLRETYLPILSGAARAATQNANQATYCAQRHPQDGRIDWSRPSRYIYNFIRSQSEPYPCSFSYYNNETVKIVRAPPLASTYFGIPGQIARIGNDGIVVCCGDNGAILIEKIEYQGIKDAAGTLIKSTKMRFA